MIEIMEHAIRMRCFHIEVWIIPVSYTHLDVYKRQVLVVSERFVAEHGIFQVAELDEKRIAQCFIGKPLQHVTEDNLFVLSLIHI